MKRQSTTAKLSKTAIHALIRFCKEYNCGVIIRFGGVEHGLTIADLNYLFAFLYPAKTGQPVPTIRKGWDSISQLGFESILTDSEFYSIVLGGPVSVSNEFAVIA